MVREANVKQAAAEKQLKEAQGKVCHVVPALHLIMRCNRSRSLSHCSIKITLNCPQTIFKSISDQS